MKITQYNNLLMTNYKYGPLVGPVSQQKIKVFPSPKTFSIWIYIYSRLVYYVFKRPNISIDTLFSYTVEFNTNWLTSFTSFTSPLNESYQSLVNLKYTLKDIIKLYNNVYDYDYNTFVIYYTWVNVACILQKVSIVNKTSNEKELLTNILDLLRDLYDNERDYINKGVLMWTAAGLYNKYSNLKINGKDLLKIFTEDFRFDERLVKDQTLLFDYIN